jgi:uncharacterized DUF497 family protein
VAKKAFDDRYGVELLDDREDYFEERFIRIAMVEGTILVVVYTERNGRFRLISARKAEKKEQDAYFRQDI